MSNSNALHRWTGVGVFLLTLAVYVKTMAPAVSFWDCGEFIATSYILGIPHPPGSPLYILLGRLFSLVPLADVAVRITFMSALSSALAVWCVYLSTLALGRRAMGGHSLKPFGDSRDIGLIAGAVVAALSLAFSYTQWFNATEAEVYGYSIFFVCFGLWLILYWEGTGHGLKNDRWLLFIAYLFGLGGGLHLLCLLIIPALAILVWFADQQLRKLIVQLIAFAVLAGLAVAFIDSAMASKLIIVAGLGGLLYYLYDHDRRACYLLLGVVLLFALGNSTYTSLYIRSGLNPAIDENDPETWKAFLSFINREQYGSDSMLLGILNPRAERMYQFWDQQMKYFFQQFPFPLLERIVAFRKATDPSPHIVWISLIPYGLGIVGLVWQAKRDWRRFAAILSIFVIMGFGLSLYLNMPDPQPRERHYVFSGMYLAFALWMGLGWTAILESLRQRLPNVKPLLLVAVALVGLALPAGVFAKLYHIQDRTGDYIAYDYAYNMLQTCEPNSILFTNGDNDTFPLWYLQEVEGIRTDVRVVNLSLLNTNWYIKQLRDREPKVDIRISDNYIDSVLTDTQLVDLYKRLWQQPRIPPEYKKMGIDVEINALPGHDLLRVQDIMVIGIIYWNEWKKPIHFAITIPTSNQVGLGPHMRMMGMTLKLMPNRDPGNDMEAIERNLLEVYQFRGLTDPLVYKDDNSRRLLGNYRACVLQLAEFYNQQGRDADLQRLMAWAEENIYMSWEGYYTAADFLLQAGQKDLAGSYVFNSAMLLLDQYGENAIATYDNILALAGVLLNEPYAQYEHAEKIYRRIIPLEPQRWGAYYELAAALQAKGEVQVALDLLQDYRTEYGGNSQLAEAEQILRNAINSGEETEDSTQP